MILRLTHKTNTKIKAGELTEMPLARNPFADWSCHLFTANRKQYILLSNTMSLYSCVMHGSGLTNANRFIDRSLNTIQEFTLDDGLGSVYQRLIAPSAATVRFAKALNRSVTGSMNELVMTAIQSLEYGDVPLHDVGFDLNNLLLSAIASEEDRGYARPKDVFVRLSMK